MDQYDEALQATITMATALGGEVYDMGGECWAAVIEDEARGQWLVSLDEMSTVNHAWIVCWEGITDEGQREWVEVPRGVQANADDVRSVFTLAQAQDMLDGPTRQLAPALPIHDVDVLPMQDRAAVEAKLAEVEAELFGPGPLVTGTTSTLAERRATLKWVLGLGTMPMNLLAE